jgi:peptidoglycan hydrolase CwlO-like protein
MNYNIDSNTDVIRFLMDLTAEKPKDDTRTALLRELEQRVLDMTESVEGFESSNDDLSDEISSLEGKVTELEERIDELQDENDKLENKIVDMGGVL